VPLSCDFKKKTRRSPSGSRAAFTLVELLVVIGILAVLAALLTPAVMNARLAARTAVIKTEIDMLHMAIMNYRNEYGSFPPCSAAPVAGSPSARHLQRLFPRCTTVVNELGADTLTPQNALSAWLKGYTADPTLPVTGAGGRRKLFDFDEGRISNGAFAPSRLANSPFIYIDNTQYLVSGSIPQFVLAGGTYAAQRIPASVSGSFSAISQPAFNSDTFQILCAGIDQVFGTDDDLSNFWSGTRKQYLDNLATQ
jgi:prepilin-type N-terminal cleavage/methylation domain-containing protein